jgi:hypothetical protein
MSTTKRIYGLYGDDDDLMHGVKAFRDKGIEIAEVYSIPVHGLDKALGLKKPEYQTQHLSMLVMVLLLDFNYLVYDEP